MASETDGGTPTRPRWVAYQCIGCDVSFRRGKVGQLYCSGCRRLRAAVAARR